MGIFGALTTAVSGMRAQAFALENVSGNIANSQTTAFKRIDTSFSDLIPDASPSHQLAGNVLALSRATNVVQGDIQSASIGTFMAVNGSGFFVVAKPASFVDNAPVFDGIDKYSRRGDFQPDKNGYLVNGAGYYLKGIPIDPTTGNLAGSVPTLLKFQNDFLPAQPTTQIEYRANLASYPLTPGHDTSDPRSELLNPANFSASPVAGAPAPARILGSGATLLGDGFAVSTGTTNISALASAGGSLVINGTAIAITAGDDVTDIETKIDAQTGTTGVGASINASGNLVLTSNSPDTAVTIGGASTFGLLTELGVSIGSTAPVNLLTQGAVAGGQTLVITIGANPATTITFGTGGGQVSTMGELATALLGLAGGTAALNTSNGNLSITAASITDTVAIGGTATPLNFGMHTVNGYPSNGTVIANDVTAFVDCSIGGGAVTCYDESGSPVNIQIRWAKLDSSVYGGTDTWNMFYQVNPNATGTAVAWQNAGVDYNFLPNGQMSPAITTINGEACGIGGWCPAGESMRIYGPNGAGSAATAPTVRRAGAGQFAVDHQDSTRAASGGTLRAIGGIDTLLALQGIGDATERRRQAVKRGRVALDVLEELKVGMLGGTLSPTVMTRLQAAAGLLRDETGESGLDSVLAEIGLRVEVELAKAGA